MLSAWSIYRNISAASIQLYAQGITNQFAAFELVKDHLDKKIDQPSSELDFEALSEEPSYGVILVCGFIYINYNNGRLHINVSPANLPVWNATLPLRRKIGMYRGYRHRV